MNVIKANRFSSNLMTFSVIFALAIRPILFTGNYIFNYLFKLGWNPIYVTIFIISIWILTIFFNFSKIKLDSLFIVCFVLLLGFVHSIFFPENKNEIVNIGILFFEFSFPAYFFLRFESDVNRIEAEFKIVAYLSLVFLFTPYIQFIYLVETSSDYMSFSYGLLFPYSYFLYSYLRYKIKIHLVITLITFLVIFIFGARGPLLASIIFFVINHFTYNKIVRASNLFILILLMFLIFIGYAVFINFGPTLIPVLNKFGFNSRTLSLIFENKNFLSLSGRDALISIVFEKLKNNWFTGIGIGGDRLLIGVYSHNIIVELIASFGLLFGILPIIFLMFFVTKVLTSSIDKKWKSLFSILFFQSFIQLQFSSSFWYSTFFFASLGLLVTINNLLNSRVKCNKFKISSA